MKQGWEIKKLGEVVTFQRGLTYSKNDEVEFSCNGVLRSNNIDLDTMSLVFDELKYVRENLVIAPDKKLSKGSILICMSNGSKQHLGKVAFIDKDYDYAFGGFMGLIKPNDDICAKYVYYTCISSSYKHFLAGVGCGANITNLKFADLAQYTIPVPERAEQERIVGELDCLSGIIAAKRAQLRELDTLAQSIFYTMFGDPITNDKGWQTNALGNVCVVNPPKKDTLADVQSDDFVSFIPMEDLSVKAGYVKSKQQRLCKDVQSSYTCFADNDVLMAKVTPCFENGKVGITQNLVNGIGFGSSEFIVIRPVNVIKEYVYFVIQTPIFIDEAVKRLTGTSGLRRVPRTYVEECIISIPPIDLQKQFAEKIENIERQKGLITKSIKETEDLFNSRMSYYFN